MVLLYKDPDGTDIFPTQTGAQVTVDAAEYDFVDIDAFKHKIKQLEDELMKYDKVCSYIATKATMLHLTMHI